MHCFQESVTAKTNRRTELLKELQMVGDLQIQGSITKEEFEEQKRNIPHEMAKL